MKPSCYLPIALAVLAILSPVLVSAAPGDLAKVTNMHELLEFVRDDLSSRAQKLTGVSAALAGFGTLFYVGHRVWKHMFNGEAIDFYPLLRPFTLLILIGMFNTVMDVVNGLLDPITSVTASMANQSGSDVKDLLAARAKQIVMGENNIPLDDPSEPSHAWRKYVPPPTPGIGSSTPTPMNYLFGFSLFSSSMSLLIKLLVSTILQLLYYAAALCIDIMRTFHLSLLAILGPLVFALSTFDGFTHSLTTWLGRYINVYLWLPIANLFSDMISTIQKYMLLFDIAQVQTGGELTFSQVDATYIIFLMIAVLGYFSVPSIANFVVQASGASSLMSRANRMAVVALKAAGI